MQSAKVPRAVMLVNETGALDDGLIRQRTVRAPENCSTYFSQEPACPPMGRCSRDPWPPSP